MELLVYIALTSIVATGLYNVFIINIQTYDSVESTMQMNQDLRAAMSLISRELRMAGCDPEETGDMGFVDHPDDRYDTDANSVHFTRDMDGDTRVDNPGEEICYFVRANADGTSQLIRRADYQGSGTMADIPLIEDVVSLNLRYFQADGTTPAVTNNDIRIVEVTLTVRTADRDALTGQFRQRSLTARTRVRNA